MVKELESKDNKTIKFTKSLFVDKKFRDENSMFGVDAYRIIKDFDKNSIYYEYLIVSKSSKYFKELSKLNNVYSVSDTLFSTIAQSVNTDGVIGVYKKIKKTLEYKQNNNYVILDKIQNPNNLGSIIRTCLAFNINGLIISNDTVDLYNPVVLRTSMGASALIPFKYSSDLTKELELLKKEDIKICATAINEKATNLKDYKFNNSNAIIFGNEGNGISNNILKLCDNTIYIKIDNIDSLNVSNSAAIVLWKLNNK